MDDLDPIAGYPTKRAMLEDLYVKEGLSIHATAKRVGVGPATIERWLRLLAIPKRGRGGDNTTEIVGWRIHRLDPRSVSGLPVRAIAWMVSASESRVWKFKRGREVVWSFVSSVQQQG